LRRSRASHDHGSSVTFGEENIMITTLLFTAFVVAAGLAGITALLVRDQIREDKLREEVGLVEIVGRDMLRLPNRILTPKGIRLKRLSIIFALLAGVLLIAYGAAR
jgi:hypothetical protein